MMFAPPQDAPPGLWTSSRPHRQAEPPEIAIQPFLDERMSTLTYLVYDERSLVGVVIDPVTDFEPRRARLSNSSNERVAAAIDRIGIDLQYVLETQVHVEHFTGISFFQDRYGAHSVVGSRVGEVQRAFRDCWGLGDALPVDGRQFDVLLGDGAVLKAGRLRIEALHTPGHTPACVSYRIGDALFAGDTLLPTDCGVGRCDLPGGSAEHLYESLQQLYALPGSTRVFSGHDRRPGGRPVRPPSTIAAQRAANVELNALTRAGFASLRNRRDAALSVTALMPTAVYFNIRAGRLPEANAGAVSYLGMPLRWL